MTAAKGRRGRPRKPTREHQLLGDHHASRINREEPDVVGGDMVPIVDLEDFSATLWGKFVPMLKNNGTIGRQDEMAFTVLCETGAKWMKMNQLVKDKGNMMPVRNEAGEITGTKETTWSRLEKSYRRDFFSMLRDFGLSAVTRADVEKLKAGDDAKRVIDIT